MNKVRFTAYISEAEDKALREMADEQGTSVNYLVRSGVRLVLGLSVPRWLVLQLEEARREAAS